MSESRHLGNDRSTWPEEAVYLFEERAAILEYMEDFSRPAAEVGAREWVKIEWKELPAWAAVRRWRVGADVG